MKREALFLTLLGLFLLTTVALAHPGGYNITWWTVDGGGGTLSAGDYTLAGTIGQPDAGAMSGGSYVLYGGFWPGSTAVGGEYRVFLPLLLRNF